MLVGSHVFPSSYLPDCNGRGEDAERLASMSTTLTPEQEADLFSGSRRTGLYATFIIFLVLINALVIAKLVLQPKPTKVSIWEDVTLAIGTVRSLTVNSILCRM